jgi:dienelactone hydrolase
MKAANLITILLTIAMSLNLACQGRTNSGAGANNSATPISSSTQTIAAEQTVRIEAPDKAILVGTFFEADKPNSPGVLLLHQWQSDRHSYDDLAKRLRARGFNVLAIDGRGFGESTKTADGATIAAERTDAAVKAMLGDVGAAFDFLSKQKNVDPNRVGIVGASYGSSLALIYATDNPKVAAVALLSPGLNYFGNMPTRPAVEKYGNRDLFVVASKGDTQSADAVEGLTIGTPRHGFMVLPVGSSHGTEMFKYRDKTDGPPVVEDALESFLMTRLGLAKADYE